MSIKLHKSATALTALFMIAAPVMQVAQAEEVQKEETVTAATPRQATYEASVLEDGSVLIDLENAKFSHSPEGDVTVVDTEGKVLETLPSDLADYEIVGRSSLVASEPGSLPKDGTSFRGFCPLGHHSDGGCRGGNVVKEAGKGAVVGAIDGCVVGGIPTEGIGCVPGALLGGTGGAVTGAVKGGLGW